MKSNHLIVSEVFYSIQGEGQTMGIPAVFLRLGGCNLLCEGRGWRCDTIEVWQKGVSTAFENVLSADHITKLKQGAHLVLTGGEPLLQQDAIFKFLQFIYDEGNGIFPIVEIETNGTIIPNWQLMGRVAYWNISPKLGNSGMPYERRVNEIACKKIINEARYLDNVIFKFVICDQYDLIGMHEDYGFIPNNKIMLMPAGATQEELEQTRPSVVELCKTFGFRYSERLHIVIWNKKTGV